MVSNTRRLESTASLLWEPHISHLHSCLTNISMWMSIGRLIIIATVTGSEFQTTAINWHFRIRIRFLAMSSCWTLLWYCTRRKNRHMKYTLLQLLDHTPNILHKCYNALNFTCKIHITTWKICFKMGKRWLGTYHKTITRIWLAKH